MIGRGQRPPRAPLPRVKICGNRTLGDVRAAAGADALGFVVASPTSRRNLDPRVAAHLARSLPPFVQAVMVTRETEPARLAALEGIVGPDAVQVHGITSRVSAQAARKALRSKLYLAVSVVDDAAAALAHARTVAPHADAVLLDTGGGGTGETHDWRVSARIAGKLQGPVILAGGLTPANVAAAIRVVKPYGVDVATGVEGPRGKSRSKIASFLEEARRHG